MSDESGVLYLNVGQKHIRNLALSLFTLRKHYSGPVCILAGDGQVQKFITDSGDKTLGDVAVKRFEFERASKRNSCYFAKTGMFDLSPFERTIFLDCDTHIYGDIRGLWPETPEVVNWTQFADWTTATKRIRNRIQNEGWPDIFPNQVARQLGSAYPALNTGVLGFTTSSGRVMKEWQKQTRKNISFICDEICAQLIAFDYPHNVMDHRWNASPRYSYSDLSLGDLQNSDVRVIHNHGGKGLKCSSEQQQMYLGCYCDAWNSNFCDIQKWDASVYGGRKHPSKYVRRFHAQYRVWCRRNRREVGAYPPLLAKPKKK